MFVVEAVGMPHQVALTVLLCMALFNNYVRGSLHSPIMAAYAEFWSPCPDDRQLLPYTHLIAAFAVPFPANQVHNPANFCDPECRLQVYPCEGSSSFAAMVGHWKSKGKKVIFA